MHRRPLLGWVLPAVITVVIAVYLGGALAGRWDPTATSGADANTAAVPESTDPGHRKAQQELCPLISEPEILAIVEQPPTNKGTGTSYDPGGAWHQCTVSLPHSALRLNVSRDGTRIADYQKLFNEAQPRTVLGRPALWLVDPAPVVNIPLKSASLLVAWDRGDTGGMVEVSILRDTIDPADEPKATQIAERQLPGLPDWP
ncbi:hypothetical protein [Dactylosporangium sp. NPDC005555]|uniref:hypothetical protein n=1 Tax=Dactylosporangium sp. NPDC005555 TaxID=3154889 RepID=UPI0033ADB8EC